MSNPAACLLSIIIPTYNGATRLPALLSALQAQNGIEADQWEIIVVDNNSTDQTAAIVQTHQQANQQLHNKPSTPPLHYTHEPRQGLAWARHSGAQAAQGQWVAFLDDDNLPAPDWVAQALTFAQTHPQAGAFGGRILGQFATEPPESLRSLLFYLALVDRGPTPLQYNPHNIGLPPGAGLVIRRSVWLTCAPQNPFFLGRSPDCPIGSEDEEVLLQIHRAGWQLWYNPAMTLQHCIGADRLTLPYFLGLMRSIGLGRFYVRMMLLPAWKRPGMAIAYSISDLLRLSLHYLRHRKTWATNPQHRCEFERHWTTWISPLYLLGHWFKRQNQRRHQPAIPTPTTPQKTIRRGVPSTP